MLMKSFYSDSQGLLMEKETFIFFLAPSVHRRAACLNKQSLAQKILFNLGCEAVKLKTKKPAPLGRFK